MNNIFVPTGGPADWRQLLADPEKHWKPGFSAHALATRWEGAKGLPPVVAKLFEPHFGAVELLLAIPEYKVPLPGGKRESQNDLFCILRSATSTIALMVEGKVDEPFDKTVGEWLEEATPGKELRLAFLLKTLGLEAHFVPTVRYQLLHRTVSAILTARRFRVPVAAMIIHSFSPVRSWFADFQTFVRLWGKSAAIGEMIQTTLPDGLQLVLGWASDELPKRDLAD